MAKENWFRTMYGAWVQERANQIAALRQEGSTTRWIWHGVIAGPPKPLVPPWDIPTYYRKPKGQNNAKYRWMEDVGVAAMSEVGVPVLGAFNISYPVADAGFNTGTHFVRPPRNPVLDTLCFVLLTLLCPDGGDAVAV
eukprot:TRINITY_DN8915_c0_g1_i4.p3 TRINITY_DN8915_c0_g1~~TRINITY_DN8915_c0_g1_i4.p3  ORF type:complete len:138 (-),score=51.24 TRINITY_DN8915_c0_g1_i4:48-461(-)